MLEKLGKTAKNITETAKVEAAIAYETAKPKIKTYIKVLIFSYLASLIITCPIIYFGITHESKNLLVIGGSLRAIFTAVILALAFPIGFLTFALLNEFRTAAKGYLKFIGSLCITELAFTLLATFIPFKDNENMILPFILVSVTAGLMNIAFFKKEVMGAFVTFSFIFILISFFLPELLKNLERKRGEMNETIGAQLVEKTCNDFEQEGIIYGNGRNKYWYYGNIKEGYRVYDGERADKFTGEKTRPFFKKDLNDYCEWEKKLEEIKKAQKTLKLPPTPASESTPVPIPQPEEKTVPRKGETGNIPPTASPAPPEVPKTPSAPNVPKVTPAPFKQTEPAKPLNPYILNYDFVNHPFSCKVAVVIVDADNRSILKSDADDLVSRLRYEKINATADLFSRQFVTDGEFERISSGDKSEIDNLNLKEKVDYIVLGKRIVITEKETLGQLVSTKINVVVEAVIISTETGEIIKKSRSKAVTPNSTRGISKENVIKAALEHLAKEVSKEIKKNYNNKIRASFIETSSFFIICLIKGINDGLIHGLQCGTS